MLMRTSPTHLSRLSLAHLIARPAVLALRIVLAMLLAGSLFVQAVMVPLLAIDLDEAGGDIAVVRTPFLVITVLGIVTVQC